MKKYYLGIDIGGTNLRFGIVDESGAIESEDFRSFPLKINELTQDYCATPEDITSGTDLDRSISDSGTKRQIKFVIENLRCFLEKNVRYNISGIGVGVAGQINEKTGGIVFSPNLNWRNVPLKTILERKTGLKVHVVNDLTAITYGEWKCGAGIGEDNILCIFVGTGIGSGIVTDGRLLSGCSGAAGEIGHTIIVSGGRGCACGNRGCLEAYAGGWGMAEIAKERALRDRVGFKEIIKIAGKIDSISAETIAKAYYTGDNSAAKLVKETGIYLADGVISAVNLMNPCVLILGGGVIDGIPDLFNTVAEEVGKRALKAAISNLKILKPTLSRNSGIIGAAGIANRN